MFHMDVTKVDRDVAHVAMIIHVCCKRLFKNVSSVSKRMLQVFYLDVAYVLYIRCKHMFQMFHLFQTYTATSVFMLQVFLCFKH
jgi:hypothetical protein